MKPSQRRFRDEAFVHRDPQTGEIRLFNVAAMIDYVTQFPDAIRLVTADLDAENTAIFKADREVLRWKIDRLQEPFASRPILLVTLANGSHLTVDGVHRWFKRLELGHTTIKAYVFELGQWEQFLITALLPSDYVLPDNNKPKQEGLDVLQLSTCKEAESVARTLQTYFFESPVRELSAHIPPEFLIRVSELVLYLLPHMKSDSESYIREKLASGNLTFNDAPREEMAEEIPAEARSAVLEHKLRVVVKLLRDAQTLNPTELRHVGALLG
jgi:hypothetical protein